MRFLTAGESHGPALTVIIDDVPAGLPIDIEAINQQLWRRQQGYGRSVRQKTESDQVQVLSGVRFGLSTGAPIALMIENKEAKNWGDVLNPDGVRTPEAEEKAFYRPRPGHADLAGFYKYGLTDLRDVLERASARETAARVAAGCIARALLSELGIQLTSHVTELGGISVDLEDLPETPEQIASRAEASALRCAGSEQTQAQMKDRVDKAQQDGDTLGGAFEVLVWNLPPGLGSYAQWDRRLDGQLAQAVMSIQAVKAVSIGSGEAGSALAGSQFQDEILLNQPEQAIYRPTNRLGGLEGGVTNGMPLLVRGVMKPISTLRKPLQSVNLQTGELESAHFERSDTTAVPACSVVAESMVAYVLANAICDKFGRDCLGDIKQAYQAYLARLSPAPQELAGR